MSTYAIGIVFDIDALGSGFYGSRAWRLFMRNITPEHIVDCTLREGDTIETLDGTRREFCIAVFGLDLDVDFIRNAFSKCTGKGFAPLNRRFILRPKIDSEPLMKSGRIDSFGRFVEDEWSRMFHDRCKDCGWGYAPRSIPSEIPTELKAELEILQKKGFKQPASGVYIASQPSSMATKEPTKRPWWKFWG
jgi:hypothetical protein